MDLLQNETYTLKDASQLTVNLPKIYMRGTKVHFEGIAGGNDQLVIEYNYLINALAMMHREQLALWYEKRGKVAAAPAQPPKRTELQRFSDWLFRRN